MVDYVALSSVLVSGAVAGGTLLANYRSGKQQREHESSLAFEERAWEQKSEALFKVISASRHLVDALDSDDEQRLVMSIAYVLPVLDHSVAAVEVYASESCRKAFDHLRGILQEANLSSLFADTIGVIRRQKEDLIEQGDLDGAGAAKDREQALFAAAIDDMNFDRVFARSFALDLIKEARASVGQSDA